MTTRQKIQNFNRRWNIIHDEKTDFIEFKNRVLNVLNKILGGIILNQDIEEMFAFLMGISIPPKSPFAKALEISQLDGNITGSFIYMEFSRASNTTELAKMIQTIFWVLEEKKGINSIDNFYKEIHQAINISPLSGISLSKKGKSIILYPVGAKLLDENLINDNLDWLADFPSSHKSFEQALSILLSGDKPKYRNMVDNLRVAVEQLLRSILGNQKSLENQSKELNAWIEQYQVHKQIQNLYNQLLFGPFVFLQNDIAKHGDQELLDCEYEYLIYLTGTFMRLLIQLHRSQP